ncbi:Aste57867_12315 [Aphanomyces stellatus]|uniref:Aste57867_12315 protein n=1 Tax=Aphanomyces stellatus TaxID=120398 RepID=A0A485KV68_9STRA|nr:hypothetical protein As57867_012269 [Aphanomyces stellatus]VFT89167.1 Aste57867_12315 [Aphanomyces stellatus]
MAKRLCTAGVLLASCLHVASAYGDIRFLQEATFCPFDDHWYPAGSGILLADRSRCLEPGASLSKVVMCTINPKTCQPQWFSDIVDTNTTVEFGHVTAGINGIGNLSDIPTMTMLRVENCAPNFTLRDFIPPPRLQNLSLINCTLNATEFYRVPWPASLSILTLNSNKLNRIDVPLSIIELRLGNNNLRQFRNFQAELEVLDLSGNNLTNLTDLNLPRLREINLDNNPNLATIANVNFTKRLAYFSAKRTPIRQFVVFDETFLSLVELYKQNASSPRLGCLFIDYTNATNQTILACNQSHGNMTSLLSSMPLSVCRREEVKPPLALPETNLPTAGQPVVQGVAENSSAWPLGQITLVSALAIVAIIATLVFLRWRYVSKKAGKTAIVKDEYEYSI